MGYFEEKSCLSPRRELNPLRNLISTGQSLFVSQKTSVEFLDRSIGNRSLYQRDVSFSLTNLSIKWHIERAHCMAVADKSRLEGYLVWTP